MNEELEKKIGKFIISIFNGFSKILQFYLILILGFPILFVVFWVPTFLLGIACFLIEKITGIDTSYIRYNQLTIPINSLLWIFDKITIFFFDFLLKTKPGIIIVILLVLVLALLEYRKKIKA
jgi:hypothetical protein